jgi:hypothetical protein
MRWGSNKYSWNGQWSGTRSEIDGEMKNGFGGVTNFNYSSKHFGVFGHYDYFNSTFKNSDIGFFGNRNDKTNFGFGFNAGQPDPQRHFRSVAVFANAFLQYNGDWLELDESFFAGGEIEFLNYWGVFAGTGRARQTYDDRDTRGGPPIVKPAARWIDMFVSTDSRRRYRMTLGNFFWNNEAGGSNRSHRLNVTLQPRPALQATLGVEYTRGLDAAQWIENVDATGDGVEDHIYGTLKRNVVSITARTTYAFTRDMTLEVYMQPFVAAGDYTNIRRFSRPKTFEFEPVVYDDNPDFNDKSLRSNVVFRWEYRRGSTLYLVWNVSNSDDSRPGVFSAFRDLRSGFGAGGTQVFMVKFNYWLGL